MSRVISFVVASRAEIGGACRVFGVRDRKEESTCRKVIIHLSEIGVAAKSSTLTESIERGFLSQQSMVLP